MAFHRLIIALAAPTVGVLIAFSAAAQQGPPRRVIADFHAVLVNIMQEAEILGYEGRYQWLEPAVRETFDLAFMAQVTAGRYWKKAKVAQKDKFVEAFSRMTVATYASRFDDYAGESFEILSQEEAPRNTLLIKSNIVKKDGSKVAINYLLRRFDEGWRIIDIHLKGNFSELATRKSEYSSILRNQGMDGLIGALDKKIAALAQESATP